MYRVIIVIRHSTFKEVTSLSLKMQTSKKSYVCDTCNKKLSSYHSLWRHKQNNICQSRGIDKKPGDRIFNSIDSLEQNVIPVVSKQNGRFVVEKDGKVQSLVNEIINDGISKNLDEPVLKKRKVSTDATGPSFLKETLVELVKPRAVMNSDPDYTFK